MSGEPGRFRPGRRHPLLRPVPGVVAVVFAIVDCALVALYLLGGPPWLLVAAILATVVALVAAVVGYSWLWRPGRRHRGGDEQDERTVA